MNTHLLCSQSLGSPSRLTDSAALVGSSPLIRGDTRPHVLLCTFRLPRFLRPCIWTIPEQPRKCEFLAKRLGEMQ